MNFLTKKMNIKNSLKNKKILITGGPVWVPLDKIRIISNVFTGELSLLLAKEAAKRGARTTLLLGPTPLPIPKELPRNLRIIRFNFFDELYELMKREISSRQYDVVVHSAAVADFTPKKIAEGKISSEKKEITIKLKPTPKIADEIKEWDPNVFLVKFKLEVNLTKKELIKRAYSSMLASKANLIIANDFKNIKKEAHRALIVNPIREKSSNGANERKNIITCRTKKEIAKKLLEAISEKIKS